jgi:hypothetical protein
MEAVQCERPQLLRKIIYHARLVLGILRNARFALCTLTRSEVTMPRERNVMQLQNLMRTILTAFSNI